MPNINDLSVETRQKIADKAIGAGMSAEQVKAQLESKGVDFSTPTPEQPTVPDSVLPEYMRTQQPTPVIDPTNNNLNKTLPKILGGQKDTSANTNPNTATSSPVSTGGTAPNVGIPGVNTPPYKTTDTATDGAVDTTTALADQNKILTDQQKNLEADKNKQIEDQKKANEDYLKELEKNKQDQIKALEQAKAEKDQLEKDILNRKTEVLDKQNKSLQDNLNTTIKDLEAQKASQAKVDLNAQIAFQKEAEAIRLRTARWGERIGLNFSSAGQQQFQTMSENALLSLETLKTQAVQNQTTIAKQISDTRLQYEDRVNANIDKYLDIVDTYKSDAIDRINNLNIDKLKIPEEILKEKKTIADDFRAFVQEQEQNFKEDQRQLAQDLVTNTENIRLNSERIKSEFLSDLDTRFQTGELSQLTPEQLAQYEKQYGLPTGSIQLKIDQGISTQINDYITSAIGSDLVTYLPDNMQELTAKVNEQLKYGLTLEQAVNKVMSAEASGNTAFANAIKAGKEAGTKESRKEQLDWAKLDLDKYKSELDAQYKSGQLSNSQYTNKLKEFELNQLYGVPGGSSSSGLDFIKSQEGFRSEPYYDVNGLAIGYGQHSINGRPVQAGDTITEEEAMVDLNNRIDNAKLNSLVKVDLTDNQRYALYDLEHNVGPGVWDYPNGKKIIDLVNKGDFEGASEVMANSGIGTTIAGTGQVNQGLVDRRKQASQFLLDTTNNQTEVIDDLDTKSLSALQTIGAGLKITGASTAKNRTELINNIRAKREENLKLEEEKAQETEIKAEAEFKKSNAGLDNRPITSPETFDLVMKGKFGDDLGGLEKLTEGIYTLTDRLADTKISFKPLNILKGQSVLNFEISKKGVTNSEAKQQAQQIKNIIGQIEQQAFPSEILGEDKKGYTDKATARKNIRSQLIAPLLEQYGIKYNSSKDEYFLEGNITDYNL